MSHTGKIWNDVLLFIVFHAVVFIGWAIALSLGASWGDIAFCAGIIIFASSAAYNHKLPHYIALYEAYICALIVIYQLCLPYAQLGEFLFWAGIIISIFYLIVALFASSGYPDYGPSETLRNPDEPDRAQVITADKTDDQIFTYNNEDKISPATHLSERVADWRERINLGYLQLNKDEQENLSRTCLGIGPTFYGQIDTEKIEETEKVMDDIAHNHSLDESKPIKESEIFECTSHMEIGGEEEKSRAREIAMNGDYIIHSNNETKKD